LQGILFALRLNAASLPANEGIAAICNFEIMNLQTAVMRQINFNFRNQILITDILPQIGTEVKSLCTESLRNF
jgi:hypothetical protein